MSAGRRTSVRAATRALAVVLWLGAGVGLAHADDLLAVLAQARAADPQFAGAATALALQDERVAQARAGLLPQWSLQASERRSAATDVTGAAPVRELGSHISQVLIDLGQWQSLSAAQTDASAEAARARAAEQALCARVARAYLERLSAEAALSNVLANEAAFEQQVVQAQARFAAGLGAAVDVDQARTFHALAQGASEAARQQVADAGEALAQLTGQRPVVLKPLVAELPALLPQPADVDAWVAQALAANPQLQAQRLSLQASGQRVSAAGSAHLPTLSAGFDSARRSGSGLSITGEAPRANTLSLTLTVPLLAGGATESSRRVAVLQRDQAAQSLEATRRELLRDTRAQYQAVQSGVATLASSRAAVNAARKALESTRTGQVLGTRSMTDLLLAIQNLSTAQSALDQARHRYVLAKLLLLQAAGSLGPAEMAAANQLLGDS